MGLRLLLSAVLLLAPLLTTTGLMAGAGVPTVTESPCHGSRADQADTSSRSCCDDGACFCDLGTSPGAAGYMPAVDSEFPRTRLSVSLPAADLLPGFAHLPDRPPNGF